ncbi:MAG: hypothetical protein JAY75_03410, partial [Candidatus Thiodiazotropha taylori]|nr:hypothetical protein [Candidatus Thiodiazotropha taylori]MCG8075275.1 hypothetical protein [Candidatus Thiodiazotropha taylori]MCW4307257.1 hypothetical protein [Candidatus Thiodiazotropha endolucinida]MCW4335250.1 hypothetical protein [Candidatus Thiodiazotropha endolucinida]
RRIDKRQGHLETFSIRTAHRTTSIRGVGFMISMTGCKTARSLPMAMTRPAIPSARQKGG